MRILFTLTIVAVLSGATAPATTAGLSVDPWELAEPSAAVATLRNCGTSQPFDLVASYPGTNGLGDPQFVHGVAFAPVTHIYAQFRNNAEFCGMRGEGCDMNYSKQYPYGGTFLLAWHCSYDPDTGDLFIQAWPDELPSGYYQINAWVQERETSRSYGSWVMQVVHCTMNQLTYAGGSQVGTRLTATFTGGSPECPHASATMRLDGVAVPATVTKTGTTYNFVYDAPAPFGAGHHTVSASVTETCCRPDGTINEATGGFSFEIQNCGSSPLQLLESRPSGMTLDNRPVIQAVFQDLHILCPVTYQMRLNSNVVGATMQQDGNRYTISYVPPFPLEIGNSYRVDVDLVETCCNAAGESNIGRASWTFQYGWVDYLGPHSFDDYVPGGGTTYSHPGADPGECVDMQTGDPPFCPSAAPIVLDAHLTPTHVRYYLAPSSTSPWSNAVHVSTTLTYTVTVGDVSASDNITLLA